MCGPVAQRIEVWLTGHGYGFEDDEHNGPVDDDAQMLIQAASLQGRPTLGKTAALPVRRFQVIGGRSFQLPPLCAACVGYNLHAGVRIAGYDRSALEALVRRNWSLGFRAR